MALPNSNISVAMVRDELGAATNDVGQLCIHPNINKWSRWKPIRYTKVAGLIPAELEAANFGLEVAEFTPADTNNPESHEFTYIQPTGGSLSPFRLGDFRGYNSVSNIWYSFLAESGSIIRPTDNKLRVTLRTVARDSTNLSFVDTGSTYRHFGALIVPQNETSPIEVVISNENLGQSYIGRDYNLDLSLSNFSQGIVYEVICFLAEYDENGEEIVGYFPLENGYLPTFTLIDFLYQITVTGEIMEALNGYYNASFQVKFEVAHAALDALEINEVDFVLRYTDSLPSDTMKAGESSTTNIQERTIYPGSSYTYTINFYDVLENIMSFGGKAYLYVVPTCTPAMDQYKSQDFDPLVPEGGGLDEYQALTLTLLYVYLINNRRKEVRYGYTS